MLFDSTPSRLANMATQLQPVFSHALLRKYVPLCLPYYQGNNRC